MGPSLNWQLPWLPPGEFPWSGTDSEQCCCPDSNLVIPCSCLQGLRGGYWRNSWSDIFKEAIKTTYCWADLMILVVCPCRRICILTTSLLSHLSHIVPLEMKRLFRNVSSRYVGALPVEPGLVGGLPVLVMIQHHPLGASGSGACQWYSWSRSCGPSQHSL